MHCASTQLPTEHCVLRLGNLPFRQELAGAVGHSLDVAFGFSEVVAITPAASNRRTREQNELPAISRDPNVIGAGCKASCAHRSLSSSGFRHSRPIGTQPITAQAIQATRGSQAFRAPGRRAATSGPTWQTSAPHAQSRYRRRPAPQATDPGHSITSYAKATPSGSFSAKPSFGSVFVGEDLEEIGSPTALLVST